MKVARGSEDTSGEAVVEKVHRIRHDSARSQIVFQVPSVLRYGASGGVGTQLLAAAVCRLS